MIQYHAPSLEAILVQHSLEEPPDDFRSDQLPIHRRTGLPACTPRLRWWQSMQIDWCREPLEILDETDTQEVCIWILEPMPDQPCKVGERAFHLRRAWLGVELAIAGREGGAVAFERGLYHAQVAELLLDGVEVEPAYQRVGLLLSYLCCEFAEGSLPLLKIVNGNSRIVQPRLAHFGEGSGQFTVRCPGHQR